MEDQIMSAPSSKKPENGVIEPKESIFMDEELFLKFALAIASRTGYSVLSSGYMAPNSQAVMQEAKAMVVEYRKYWKDVPDPLLDGNGA